MYMLMISDKHDGETLGVQYFRDKDEQEATEIYNWLKDFYSDSIHINVYMTKLEKEGNEENGQ